MARLGLLFPGQGFQRVGLLKNMHKKYRKFVDPVLEQADAALPALSLSKALKGSEDYTADVTPTDVAQPLILTASIAYYEVYKHINPSNRTRVALGHSLGEYTAFVAAGYLPFSDALALVRERGLLMRTAAESAAEPSGMTLVVKPRRMPAEEFTEAVEQAAQKLGLGIAGYNSESQTLLSGATSQLEQVPTLLKKPFITKQLNVSGAFHSKYMAPAQDSLHNLVEKAPWTFNPKVKVISNVTAREYESIDEIKDACVRALTEPVLWRQSVLAAAPYADEFLSVGPGSIGKNTEAELEAATELTTSYFNE